MLCCYISQSRSVVENDLLHISWTRSAVENNLLHISWTRSAVENDLLRPVYTIKVFLYKKTWSKFLTRTLIV